MSGLYNKKHAMVAQMHQRHTRHATAVPGRPGLSNDYRKVVVTEPLTVSINNAGGSLVTAHGRDWTQQQLQQHTILRTGPEPGRRWAGSLRAVAGEDEEGGPVRNGNDLVQGRLWGHAPGLVRVILLRLELSVILVCIGHNKFIRNRKRKKKNKRD